MKLLVTKLSPVPCYYLQRVKTHCSIHLQKLETLQKERALWSEGQQDEQILALQIATYNIIRFAACR